MNGYEMATTSAPRHVLLAGGGSGGHVFPALAVGDELRARGWRVSFVGMTGGMEERLVADRGLPFHGLPAKPGEEGGPGGWRVSCVGMRGGREERLVAARGLPFHGLPAKPFVGRGFLGKT